VAMGLTECTSLSESNWEYRKLNSKL